MVGVFGETAQYQNGQEKWEKKNNNPKKEPQENLQSKQWGNVNLATDRGLEDGAEVTMGVNVKKEERLSSRILLIEGTGEGQGKRGGSCGGRKAAKQGNGFPILSSEEDFDQITKEERGRRGSQSGCRFLGTGGKVGGGKCRSPLYKHPQEEKGQKSKRWSPLAGRGVFSFSR